MEKRNSINQRFINLREVFHDFQTSVRFSTSSTVGDIFANHLKCYEFLGELEEHFMAQKAPQLYQFVHSIFSLIFTMIREGPSNRQQKAIQLNKVSQNDVSVQTQFTNTQDTTKSKVDMSNFVNQKHRKRSCVQIQIFQKDLTQMDFRQRRRALKKMRDIIYTQDDTVQAGSFLNDFKPNIQKIGYSKSDQSIKAAIDKFKQSDISTHIFLKHFMNEFVQIKDIKQPSELLNKQIIQSMSRTVHRYRDVKMKQKEKLKMFNHIIEEIVYPQMNRRSFCVNGNGDYLISVKDANQYNKKHKESSKQLSGKQLSERSNQMSELSYKIMKSQSNKKLPIKRQKFPSLLLKPTQQLNPIHQIPSQSSIRSSKSSNSNTTIQKQSRIKMRRKDSRQRVRNSSSFLEDVQRMKHKRIMSKDILQQINNRQKIKSRSRSSFRRTPQQNDQNLKQLQAQKSKQLSKFSKLKKRSGSQYFQNMQQRFNRKSLQAK